MPVTRLNHAVLYVRDVEVTKEFYVNAMGFVPVMEIPGRAVFFRAPGSTNDHDLGTFQIGSGAGPTTAGRSSVGLYHLAWEVDTLSELKRHQAVLAERGALVGMSDHSTTKSLYCMDPDGLEFEVCWVLPADVLTPEILEQGRRGIFPLDIDREIERFGAETRGGIGISFPALT